MTKSRNSIVYQKQFLYNILALVGFHCDKKNHHMGYYIVTWLIFKTPDFIWVHCNIVDVEYLYPTVPTCWLLQSNRKLHPLKKLRTSITIQSFFIKARPSQNQICHSIKVQTIIMMFKVSVAFFLQSSILVILYTWLNLIRG